MIIEDTEFFENSAQIFGGAIYTSPGFAQDGEASQVSMTSSKFTSNSARVGGAIFVDDSGELIDRNSAFTENIANTGVLYPCNLESEACTKLLFLLYELSLVLACSLIW